MRSPLDNDGLKFNSAAASISRKIIPPAKNSLGNDTAGGKSKHGYELVGFSLLKLKSGCADFKLVAEERCREMPMIASTRLFASVTWHV